MVYYIIYVAYLYTDSPRSMCKPSIFTFKEKSPIRLMRPLHPEISRIWSLPQGRLPPPWECSRNLPARTSLVRRSNDWICRDIGSWALPGLVNCSITMENHHAINGKIRYFYDHFRKKKVAFEGFSSWTEAGDLPSQKTNHLSKLKPSFQGYSNS